MFVSADQQTVLNGHIIEHMHRNNYHLVEVPTFSTWSDYYETHLYHLSNGQWDRVNAQCGGCRLYLRSDKTPTIDYIMPGNAMNIFQTGFWTSWRSLDDPNDTHDHESLHYRLKQEWDDLSTFCHVPIAIQARRVDTQTPAQDTDQAFRYFSADQGFYCYGEDQVTGQSTGQCYDYETRYYCERGVRFTGQLFTDRYGEENEIGNRLRGPAELRDGEDFTLANCDYVWRNPDDDTIHKSHTATDRAICNIDAKAPTRAIGHYNFGTQTYDQGRGKMHSQYNYIGPGPDYKWYDFTLHGQVNSVTPNNGSVGGGQLITVQGDGFTADSVVTIGHQDCVTESFDETAGTIVCRTPADESQSCGSIGDHFPGSRGLLTERYEHGSLNYNHGTWQTIGQTTTLQSWVTEATTYNEAAGPSWFGSDHYQLRSSGYFVPPLTGYYSFHGNS